MSKAALVELVYIDQERRIRAGEAVAVEWYRQQFPELAALLQAGEGSGDDRDRASGAESEVFDRANSEPGHGTDSTLIAGWQPDGQRTVSMVQPAGPSRIEEDQGIFGSAPLRRFGGYELLEEIARGGMGIVYKARQIKANRTVALKMILGGQLASVQDVKRFETEASAAATLDHPNIVPIFEVGEQDGRHFYSMGFVDGKSLSDVLREGPLAPQRAARLMREVAQAVDYAHAKGIIHRDLKPQNILLSREGSPRVADFGLAKQMAGAGELTATGQILGTPNFMSPEQARGDRPDGPSRIFIRWEPCCTACSQAARRFKRPT